MKNKRTQAEFIQEAINLHPEYDYSKAIYKNSDTPVLLQCKIHGEFNVTPYRLLKKGAWCQKCSIEENSKKHRLAPAKFIERAKKVFPEYDYSKTEYIQCAIDANADKCRLTQEEFILKVKKIHPSLDYSLVNFTRTADKVVLICKKHGPFTRKANDILRGGGCPKCGIQKRAGEITKSQEDFIKEASQKFPDLNFMEAIYKTSDEKVTVICKKHGRFFITPTQLLGKSKHGCPNCAIEAISSELKFSNEEYIEKAKKVFPEYDYSNVHYVNQDSKVSVVCPKHGEFDVRAGNLLARHGCPVCNAPKGELYIRNWLIQNHIKYKFQYKFKDLGNISYDFIFLQKTY